MDAFSFGFGDEGMGLAAGLGAMASGEDFSSAFRAAVQRSRADLARARQEHRGWTEAGALAGGAASFFIPGGILGRAAQAGRFGAPVANFLARGAGRGLGAWGRQALTSGVTGAAMGGVYGYGSGSGNLAPVNLRTGELSERWGNVPMNALFGGGSSAIGGPAINAALRIPGHAVARGLGLGRPAGAPRVRGHVVNAFDRAMGDAGDDIALFTSRVRRNPDQSMIDVLGAQGFSSRNPYRRQYNAAGGNMEGGAAQAARMQGTTGGSNIGLMRDVLTHNYGGAAMNLAARGGRRALTSIDPAENQALLNAFGARTNSRETDELIRMLAHRESGRQSRAGPEAVGEGFGNAAFFGQEEDTPYDYYDTMSADELERELERAFR